MQLTFELKKFSNRSKNLNQKGFGLLGVLLSVALFTTVAFSVAVLSASMSRYSANFNVTSNSHGIQKMLTGIISYPNLCTSSLLPSTSLYDATVAATPDGFPIGFQIGASPNGGTTLADNSLLANYFLKINKVRFRPSGPPTADLAVPGNQIYSGSLFLELQKSGADPYLGGNQMKEKLVGSMVLSVNNVTNQITSCYAISGVKQNCVDVGGTYNPSSTPQCKLPYPCGVGLGTIFMGYAPTTGSPICSSAADLIGQACPVDTYMVSNGDGTSRCQHL